MVAFFPGEAIDDVGRFAMSGEQTRTGGELLVQCLIRQGVDTVFGVPGESYLAVLDALHDARNQVRLITCRQEGGAAYMSSAYGKLTGRPGVCFVTRGPGATNASVGVHTAAQDSSPMVLFVGQVAREASGREAFQEIDYGQFFGSLAKWVVEVRDPARLPELVGRAFARALRGRPGPVVVSLPEDMLRESTTAVPGPRVLATEPGLGERTRDEVLDLLATARRPLVLVGGGGWTGEGRADLARAVERHDLPVLAAFRYQDLLDNDHPCYAGHAGVGMPASVAGLLRDCDLLLAVGTRLGDITTDGYSLLTAPEPAQRLVHVHASDAELGKVYAPALAVHCGPNAFFAAMAQTGGAQTAWARWRSDARDAYLATLHCPPQPGALDLGTVTAWLQENLPADVIVTNGAGNFSVWPNRFLRYRAGARLLGPQSGSMGYGLPAAVAACLAEPQRTVVCFCGDGDFLMNGQELATAVQHGARPIVLLVNNAMYGTIRMHQERHYPGRVYGTALRNPDFVRLAHAYGLHAERVATTDAFPAAFERARAAATGALLELPIDTEALTPFATVADLRRT